MPQVAARTGRGTGGDGEVGWVDPVLKSMSYERYSAVDYKGMGRAVTSSPCVLKFMDSRHFRVK